MKTAAETGALFPASANNNTSTLRTLFDQRFRTRTLPVSLPWMTMDVATYGVGLFTPVILGALHFASSSAGTVASVWFAFAHLPDAHLLGIMPQAFPPTLMLAPVTV